MAPNQFILQRLSTKQNNWILCCSHIILHCNLLRKSFHRYKKTQQCRRSIFAKCEQHGTQASRGSQDVSNISRCSRWFLCLLVAKNRYADSRILFSFASSFICWILKAVVSIVKLVDKSQNLRSDELYYMKRIYEQTAL